MGWIVRHLLYFIFNQPHYDAYQSCDGAAASSKKSTPVIALDISLLFRFKVDDNKPLLVVKWLVYDIAVVVVVVIVVVAVAVFVVVVRFEVFFIVTC